MQCNGSQCQCHSNAEAVAALAGEGKLPLYGSLVLSHYLAPVLYRLFLKELGHRVFLLQHLSIAVQRGNAASVLASAGLRIGTLVQWCLGICFCFLLLLLLF